MALSNDLISQFVKATNDKSETKKETTIVYGTTVVHNGETYVQIDGSELLTPISTTADTIPGERVIVTIKNHTATITGNISSPSARTEDVKNIKLDSEGIGNKISEFEIIIADKVDTLEFNAVTADIDKLKADVVIVRDTLVATNAEVDTLQADNVIIKDQLTAYDADIENLEVTKLDAGVAEITYAKIVDMEAVNAEIDLLEAGVADIDTLIFGTATGNVIQTTFSNAVIAQLGNAQIKSAMIESVSADKITAGDIITNNVRVKSEDGSLLISDETMQISDDTRVRVQIGKDASNDYSINIWDEAGNLMFSKGGISDSAIKEAIIRNDMVSDTANISAHKLDIDSLFEEINGSNNTIKSTQIYLDDEEQTLNLAFKTLETSVDELDTTVTSHGTDISVIQGQIASKIWLQDLDGATGDMNVNYTEMKQDLDSFKTTVSTTYVDKTTFNELDIGGRNLYKGTGDFNSKYWHQYGSLEPYENDPTYKQAVCVNSYSTASGQLLASNTASQGFDFSDTSKTWTISAMMKGTADNQTVAITLDADRIHWWAQPILNGTWKKMVWTFTGSKSLITFRFTSANVSAETPIYIAQVKVEEGNKATTWTPAPEDVQSEIDTAQAAAEAAQTAANKNAADMATIVANFNKDVTNLQTQIDGSITSWFYEVDPTISNEPAVNWTTTELKNVHLGDLYYNTVSGYCYRWQVKDNVYSWELVKDTDVTKALSDAKSAQDTADQKRRVFYTTPIPPYDKGDLWVQGGNGDILRCNTAKASGQSYAASDWVAASKYTDDTVANQAKNAAANAQSTADTAQSNINNLSIGARNLIIRSQSTADAYYDQNGNYVTGTGAGTAAMNTYIPIEPGTQYTFSRAAGGGDYFRFNWYDADKNYISRKAITDIPSNAAGIFTWTAPSTAYYILVSYPWDEVSKAKLERGNRATDWTPAPEDVQAGIEVVETRVTSAETKITQNKESIESVANRTTAVENKFSGYSTTEQMQSAINQRANEITSSVSSTYATKTSLSATDKKASDAATAAANAQKDIDGLSVGGTNLLRNSNFANGTTYWTGTNVTMNVVSDSTFGQALTFYTAAAGSSYYRIYADTVSNFTHKSNTQYTLSFWAKASANTTIQTNVAGSLHAVNHSLTTSWKQFVITYTTTSTGSITFWPNTANVTIYLTNVKLELGNMVTDWSPSPKDIETRVSSAETKINQNASSISAVASRTTNAETAIASLELTADGLTAKVDAAKKQKYHECSGTSGTAGYIGICTISVKGSYQNRPITFGLTNRGQQSTVVSWCFSNVSTADPALYHLQYDGGIKVWAYKSTASTWILIVQKSEAYDTIYVNEFVNNNGNTTVTWTNTHYTSLPTSNITEGTKLAGKLEKTVVDNAAKTATNYLKFSNSGLIVGDHTGSSLGKNVLIDSDSVDIRNGDTVLASFGANTVTLGQNSAESVIDLCDGAGTIKALISETENSYPAYDSLQLESQKLQFNGKRIYHNTEYTDSTSLRESSMTLMTANSGIGSDYTITASGDKNQVGVSGAATSNYVSTHYDVYAEHYDASAGTWLSNRVSVYPLRTQFSKEITIMGNRVTGANNVLWTGGYYMTSGHSCTLSEGVYDQTNGIVLIFSEYRDGASVNNTWHSFFVPKEMVVLHGGAGHCFQMSTSNLAYYGTKYLYISNTKITGHDNNSLTGSTTCGITKTCNRFVLRYVIGV